MKLIEIAQKHNITALQLADHIDQCMKRDCKECFLNEIKENGWGSNPCIEVYRLLQNLSDFKHYLDEQTYSEVREKIVGGLNI